MGSTGCSGSSTINCFQSMSFLVWRPTYLRGTPKNQFLVDVWWNNHFQCKDLESSNGNNRHFFKFPFTLRHPQELTRVDLRICRFRGDLSVEVGHALNFFRGLFCLNVAPDLFFKGETHLFHCKQGEIFLGIFLVFVSMFCFFSCLFFRHACVVGGWWREGWETGNPWDSDCYDFPPHLRRTWGLTAGQPAALIWGRIPGQALAFGMVNCGPRRTDPRSNLFSICFRKGRDWFHLICGWTMESC